MVTLADLKSRIADDLARSDLTNQIAAAIADAIAHFQTTRFYFNETRATTFQTVSGQTLYSAADQANIPLFFEFDDVFITVTSATYPMRREDADLLEELVSTNGANGDPYAWAWVAQSIRVYPIPNATRTIRIVGAIKQAAPTDDTDSTNVWITEAFELIRSYAKGLLYAHVIKDAASTALMLGEDREGGLVGMARVKLEKETAAKRATGRITPTGF